MIYTKNDFIRMFQRLDIHRNDIICLQADLSTLSTVVSGYAALIEALQEIVGPEGTIFVPTFTYSCLDPSCNGTEKYPIDQWNEIRENILPFDSQITMSESELANQFLRYPNVQRTFHPVYSFAYWGRIDPLWLEQPMDHPISFRHVLRSFAYEKAKNILIGIPSQESVLIPAIARTMKVGMICMNRGLYYRHHRTQIRNFLHINCDEVTQTEVLQMCIQKKYSLQDIELTCLSLE